MESVGLSRRGAASITRHQEHHYIPYFLLKQWHGGTDRLLSRWSWLRGALHHQRCSAKGNAVATGLYSLRGGSSPNVIEREFFQSVDANAAAVHRRFVTWSHGEYRAEGRIAWSTFLVSLMLRTPSKVAEIRRKGAEGFGEEAAKNPDEYTALASETDPASLTEWVRANAPTVFDDLGIATLPSIVTSEVLNPPILAAHWRIMKLRSPISLVIGDCPLVYVGAMSKSFLLALPLSPSHVFLAFNNPDTGKRIGTLTPLRLSKDLNKASVGNAQQYVYAGDETHRVLVEKHLRQPHPA